MLQSGVMKPTDDSSALTAEQSADFKRALIKHSLVPVISNKADSQGLAMSTSRIQCLTEASAVRRVLAGAKDESKLLPVIADVQRCVSIATSLQAIQSGADVTADHAKTIVFGLAALQKTLAEGPSGSLGEISESEWECLEAWVSASSNTEENRLCIELCSQGIQPTLATLRAWIVDVFNSKVDLGNLDNEDTLTRHAALNMEVDIPHAIHVTSLLPNSEQKVLELQFVGMWAAYSKAVSKAALYRMMTDRKARKATEENVVAIQELLARLRELSSFSDRLEGARLFSTVPKAVNVKEALLNKGVDLSATVFHLDALSHALQMGQGLVNTQLEEWSDDASGLCALVRDMIGSTFYPSLPSLYEDDAFKPLRAVLENTDTFKKITHAGRILQNWLALFKRCNRVCEPKPFRVEVLSSISDSCDFCVDVAAVCQAVYMINVELPTTKNAMLRRKKANDFIVGKRMEQFGESISKRLASFKHAQSGLADPALTEGGAPSAKRAKTSGHAGEESDS